MAIEKRKKTKAHTFAVFVFKYPGLAIYYEFKIAIERC
jgi:hypothetical protein